MRSFIYFVLFWKYKHHLRACKHTQISLLDSILVKSRYMNWIIHFLQTWYRWNKQHFWNIVGYICFQFAINYTVYIYFCEVNFIRSKSHYTTLYISLIVVAFCKFYWHILQKIFALNNSVFCNSESLELTKRSKFHAKSKFVFVCCFCDN